MYTGISPVYVGIIPVCAGTPPVCENIQKIYVTEESLDFRTLREIRMRRVPQRAEETLRNDKKITNNFVYKENKFYKAVFFCFEQERPP